MRSKARGNMASMALDVRCSVGPKLQPKTLQVLGWGHRMQAGTCACSCAPSQGRQAQPWRVHRVRRWGGALTALSASAAGRGPAPAWMRRLRPPGADARHAPRPVTECCWLLMRPHLRQGHVQLCEPEYGCIAKSSLVVMQQVRLSMFPPNAVHTSHQRRGDLASVHLLARVQW